MAASEVAICNLALRHLGVDVEIASLSEKSKYAQVCNRFYTETRDQALRDFPWPFARRDGVLALLVDTPRQWQYAYRLPTNCLFFRRILSGFGRKEFSNTRVQFDLTGDSTGGIILTDEPDAVGEWTELVSDPTKYPPDFTQALALLLAAHIAPSVTAGDKYRLGDRAIRLYSWRMSSAQANAANEAWLGPEGDSDFIRSRD